MSNRFTVSMYNAGTTVPLAQTPTKNASGKIELFDDELKALGFAATPLCQCK